MTPDVETLVIGAGAVGLACAKALAAAGQEVLVLEAADIIGAGVSSRNSEVIHAGLYYQPGSFRARFCVAGKKALYRFCAENGVAVKRSGKLVVATRAAEIPRLKALAENARANGVDDLTLLTGAEARALEPQLACEAALLSPSTGVFDSHGYMLALQGHLEHHGGQVVLNSKVTDARPTAEGLFRVETEGAALTCRRLVNAAGLGASEIGARLHREGPYRAPQTYPAKGHWFQATGAAPFKHLIYPLPDGAWLGLHLTIDVAGRVRLGPDLEWVEGIDYRFEDPAGARRATFLREVRRYWPDLPEDALVPDTTGIRPKIYRKGEPVADFAVHGPAEHGLANLVGLYGIESPGLTASLAIGEHVAGLLRDG
ncbi:MAG: NAD(P)/FAD-dependent oxidoreductase [Pseudomonadota bacterium]